MNDINLIHCLCLFTKVIFVPYGASPSQFFTPGCIPLDYGAIEVRSKPLVDYLVFVEYLHFGAEGVYRLQTDDEG